MTEKEKVINGLEQFVADFKPYCGNEADWQRVYDALALLKEQIRTIEQYEREREQQMWNMPTMGGFHND